MTTAIDDFLAHYGVLGMKWGVRKDASSGGASDRKRKRALRKEYRSDRRQLTEANKARGKGVMAKRKEAKDKIVNRINTDKEYAEAVKQVGKNDVLLGKAILMTAAVGMATMPLLLNRMERRSVRIATVRGFNKMSSATRSGINYGAHGAWSTKASRTVRKIRNNYSTYHRNPKKSAYWNKMTVKGSSSMVGSAVDLYRRR